MAIIFPIFIGMTCNLILYTDGACRGGKRASAAWVIRAWERKEDGDWQSRVIVDGGMRLPDGTSAFKAEVAALMRGTAVLRHLVCGQSPW